MQQQLLLIQAAPGGGLNQMLLMFGLILIIFYFFMIRPQTRKARESKDFLSNIKKGEKLITIGGIHGKVLRVDEKSVLLEVDSNTKLRIDKSAISIDMTKSQNESKDKIAEKA